MQTQALQLQNLVALYRVLGGGWKEGAEPADILVPTTTPMTSPAPTAGSGAAATAPR